jgi:hypothetical protein
MDALQHGCVAGVSPQAAFIALRSVPSFKTADVYSYCLCSRLTVIHVESTVSGYGHAIKPFKD